MSECGGNSIDTEKIDRLLRAGSCDAANNAVGTSYVGLKTENGESLEIYVVSVHRYNICLWVLGS